jgi:hypothetical protein
MGLARGDDGETADQSGRIAAPLSGANGNCARIHSSNGFIGESFAAMPDLEHDRLRKGGDGV